MARIDEVLAEFRKAVLEGESKTVQRIIDRYAIAENRIARLLLQLLEKLDAAGTTSPASWLSQADRLEALLKQTTVELTEWTGLAGQFIETGQSSAVAIAAEAAFEYSNARAPDPSIITSWNRLPIEAMERFIGVTGDGSPLSTVFNRYGTQGATAMEDGIFEAIALGINPKIAGRRIRDAMAGSGVMPPGFERTFEGLQQLRYAATVTARTEFIRAHNGATLDNYRANDDVVIGYESRSARDVRTCIICWAADGEIFPLSKTVTGWHIQCRCVWLPVLEGMRPGKTGPQIFRLLSESDQLEILGPGKLDLYKSGTPITAFSHEFDDEKWGIYRRERTLKELYG